MLLREQSLLHTVLKLISVLIRVHLHNICGTCPSLTSPPSLPAFSRMRAFSSFFKSKRLYLCERISPLLTYVYMSLHFGRPRSFPRLKTHIPLFLPCPATSVGSPLTNHQLLHYHIFGTFSLFQDMLHRCSQPLGIQGGEQG